jgi:hypothetical protein
VRPPPPPCPCPCPCAPGISVLCVDPVELRRRPTGGRWIEHVDVQGWVRGALGIPWPISIGSKLKAAPSSLTDTCMQLCKDGPMVDLLLAEFKFARDLCEAPTFCCCYVEELNLLWLIIQTKGRVRHRKLFRNLLYFIQTSFSKNLIQTHKKKFA